MKIIVLEIHPSTQVDPEKQCDVNDDNTVTIRGKSYTIDLENIFRKGDCAYAIYLTGLGFLSTTHIADSLM